MIQQLLKKHFRPVHHDKVVAALEAYKGLARRVDTGEPGFGRGKRSLLILGAHEAEHRNGKVETKRWKIDLTKLWPAPGKVVHFES